MSAPHSPARAEALARFKRQFKAETEARPVRCDRCKRAHPKEHVQQVPRLCGLRVRTLCNPCVSELQRVKTGDTVQAVRTAPV